MTETLNQVQEAFDAVAPEQEPQEKFVFSIGELYDQSDEEQKWLIKDLIPRGIVNMLIGQDGVGKTQLLTQLCLHIVLAKDSFMGLELTPKVPFAIVAATEDDNRRFANALKKQLRSMVPDITSEIAHKIGLRFLEGCTMNNMQEFADTLEAELKIQPVEIIVMDAVGDLFQLMNGDMNSNDDARKLLGKLSRICTTYDVTIIAVHHVAKGKMKDKVKNGELFIEKDDTLGAGSLSARPRNVLALTHDKTTKSKQGDHWCNYLHLVKTNFASHYYMNNALELMFNQNTLLHTFKQTIDIDAYTNGDGTEDRKQVSQPKKQWDKTKPKEEEKPDYTKMTDDLLRDKVKGAFNNDYNLQYDDLVARLAYQFGVGQTKVRKSEGLKDFLVGKSMIYKFGPAWQICPQKFEEDKKEQPGEPDSDNADELPF